MKEQDEAFYQQIAYLLQQYREGHVKSISDLMRLIQMMYGDYMEFYPDELPETKYEYKSDSVSGQSGQEPKISSSGG